jgi:hypothetical protein
MFDHTRNSQATKFVECEITGFLFIPKNKKDRHVSFVAKFWSKVDRTKDKDECWPWNGGTDKDGYGVFSPPKKKLRPIRPTGYRT